MNVGFQRVVPSRLWLTFVVLAASFLVGALGTVNPVVMLAANVRQDTHCNSDLRHLGSRRDTRLHDYGFMAVVDGGLRQLVELVLQGFVSCGAYVVLKTCEHRLSIGWDAAAV